MAHERSPDASTPKPSADAGHCPEWREALERHVATRGLRLTQQRLAIADVFFAAGGHANADELYQRVRESHPSIGYATVYRTLRLFEEAGLATTHQFADGTTRYEAQQGDDHHDHLICLDCKHIVEFENDAIEALQERIAADHGFRLVEHRMELYGRCTAADCPRKRPGGRR